MSNNPATKAYMDKIVGLWNNDQGQTVLFKPDGTYTAQIPMAGTIAGRYTFSDGYYVTECNGIIMSAFQILEYDEAARTMTTGMNTGEIHRCWRIDVDGDDWLKPGCRVVLTGLVGKKELNGSGGTVKSFDEATQRYIVFVDRTQREMKICKDKLQPPNNAPRNHNVMNNNNMMNDPMAMYLNSLNAQQNAQNQFAGGGGQYAPFNFNTGGTTDYSPFNFNTGGTTDYNPFTFNSGGNSNQYNPFTGNAPMNNGSGSIGGKKPNKKWNAFKWGFQQAANDIDPSAAGEFAGAAAGEFVQGVGFDLGGFGFGALFGM